MFKVRHLDYLLLQGLRQLGGVATPEGSSGTEQFCLCEYQEVV